MRFEPAPTSSSKMKASHFGGSLNDDPFDVFILHPELAPGTKGRWRRETKEENLIVFGVGERVAKEYLHFYNTSKWHYKCSCIFSVFSSTKNP